MRLAPQEAAEPTAFATESNQLLVMTGLTPYSRKSMLEATTLQVVLELPDDITGQGLALLR